MIELDNIYNCDCLDGMKMIPDGMVDAVICDLPYGVLNKNNRASSWDEVIPFDKLWEQYERICKPTAAIVLFAQGMFTAKMMMSKEEWWRYNLIWKKGNRVTGFLNAGNQPLRCHEDICVFYREQCTYNPQKTPGAVNHVKTRNNATKEEKVRQGCYGDFIFNSTDLSGMKHPKSIIDIDKEYDFTKVFHPTQKPVDLLRYLVLTYTDSGGVVLDNCSGSGTTAIACIKEKRHFICFEKDETYWKKSVERVKNEQRQLTLW